MEEITVTEEELDNIIGEPEIKSHNHQIADKIIHPTSLHYGKKGESYMLYLGGGEEQWYFIPKDDTEPIRVKWWALDSNVAEGDYGKARYIGFNASIKDKIGTLIYNNKKWCFLYDEVKYKLVNPESVEIL